MPICWVIKFYLTSSLLGLFVRVHVACICFRYTRHHIKNKLCIPSSVRLGALTRVELPPWLTTQVGGLSRMGRPSAVYDKTTLAVLWQARRDGVELDFLWLPFLKYSASYHIMLWLKLKVRGTHVYKASWPNIFPCKTQYLPQFFFDKNLVLAPTPTKLRQKYFFIAFLSSLKLTLPAYVKK